MPASVDLSLPHQWRRLDEGPNQSSHPHLTLTVAIPEFHSTRQPLRLQSTQGQVGSATADLRAQANGS